MRHLAVLLAIAGLSCRSQPSAPLPAPQSMETIVSQFLGAVKAHDLARMGTLWGTDRGPAVGWMAPEELKQRLTVIQKYLDHDGYRVVEGPLAVTGHANERTYRVELQRASCNIVIPLDLVQARSGAWLVADVHLEAVSNPALGCKPPGEGTRP